MSERMRAMMAWVSGSPKRALNSSTFGPDSVIISPAKSTPWKRRPSEAIPAIVGTTISCMMRLWASRRRLVVGETVPIPPVLGPWSPSRARLWSWTEASGTTRAPSESTRKDTSSPWRNSSMTTLAPALPKRFSLIISSTAVRASAASSTMTLPLPAASPSAFTTKG